MRVVLSLSIYRDEEAQEYAKLLQLLYFGPFPFLSFYPRRYSLNLLFETDSNT